MPSFEYFYTQQATGQIDIENLGEFALSCTNDDFQEFILVVHTTLGLTKILEYGPLSIDDVSPVNFCTCNYSLMPYDESKLSKLVNRVLNDTRRAITQCTLIDADTAINRIPKFKEMFCNDTT